MDLTRSVLARPGAPVMRQWPPANNAMRSCSITSFCPTMTLASSDWIWARPERICSTVCFSVVVESVVISMRLAFQLLGSSMGHRVKDNVDCERVGDFFREMLEVIVIVAFPLPAVAIVGIVRGNHHHAALVVEDGAMVHHGGVRAFPGAMLGIEFALRSEINVGHLALGLDAENALVERVVQGQLDEIPVRENFLHLLRHPRPFPFAPEIVQHQTAAVQPIR